MDLLRVVLFAGLVLHKLVWEVLKSGASGKATQPQSASLFKRLVKAGKSAVLLGLVVQTLFFDILPITEHAEALRVLGTAVFALGLATAILGRWQLGKSWANLEDYQVPRGQALVNTGLYHYIRHPIYTGDLLLLTGLELALNSWLVLGVLAVFVVVLRQTSAEEVLLAKALDGYEDYCRQTKRFIPFVI